MPRPRVNQKPFPRESAYRDIGAPRRRAVVVVDESSLEREAAESDGSFVPDASRMVFGRSLGHGGIELSRDTNERGNLLVNVGDVSFWVLCFVKYKRLTNDTLDENSF